MNTKLGQEPAFPTDRVNSQQGVSKRFYAACSAMQGLLAAGRMTGHQIDELISNSYEIADELLRQENDEPR